jgi:tripartite-type tricarboxylate transporter receptor subunit TctC
MDEAGVKGYEVLNWFGLFAPAGTPAPIVARMHAEAKAIASTPSDFTAFVKAEMQQWTEVGRAAKIQPAD